MNSLYKRQVFLIFGIIFTAFFVSSLGLLVGSQKFFVNELQRESRKNAQFLSAFTTSYLKDNNLSDEYYRSYVKNIALVSESFLFVTALDGSESYATDGTYFYPIKRNDVSYGVVDAIVAGAEYETYTDLGGIFTEERYIYGVTYNANVNGVAVPVGIVIFSYNTEQLDTLIAGIMQILTVITCWVLAVTLPLLSYLTARQVRPLKELAETARRFGQGELTARVEGYDLRRDEVGELARDFNAMALSLSQAEEQRRNFISNVSHELRTPMTTIAGFAEGLLDGTVSEQRRTKAVEIILSETRRLSRLVQQMLNIARMEVEEELVQEQFDLIDLLAQVIISMEGRISSRNLDVDVDIPQGELLVWGRRDGITQVVYNLLDNGVKFSTEGTTLVVSVEVLDKKVHISVCNQGETLPPEELPRLFQQFHKADDSRRNHPEGLGLGLYIVKSILHSLQESIRVTSRDGLTCFTFTLSLVV